jgi:membrane protease YdiL (CAAX protease family)
MGPTDTLVQAGATLVGFGVATWLIGFKALRLTREDLRWAALAPGLRGFGVGLLLGVVPAGFSLALALAVGGASVVQDQGSLPDYLGTVALTTLVLAPAALAEEVMFRGVPQVTLARSLGRWPAIVLVSALFGLIHAFNPNQGPLGVFNAAVAGVLLTVAFYLPGGLWTAVGAHLGWNATIAALDAPVSGLIFPIPWLDYRPGRPEWLTGGSFGPEGGVLATVALGLAIGLGMRWMQPEQG